MEYDELVEFYKRKLRERYMMREPERRRLLDMIRSADAETVGAVIAMLEKKRNKEGA